MCGRYHIDDKLLDHVQERLSRIGGLTKDLSSGKAKPFFTDKDIHPSDPAPVLRGDQDEILLDQMTFGYPGFTGGKLLINARAETALEKQTFRADMLARRCILPAAGFYEWDREGQIAFFKDPVLSCLFLGGCFREGRFVILTREANGSVSPVHSRMPLLIGDADVEDWLRGKETPEAVLQRDLPELTCKREYEQLRLPL